MSSSAIFERTIHVTHVTHHSLAEVIESDHFLVLRMVLDGVLTTPDADAARFGTLFIT
jgi:hypothetical protein